MIRALRPLARLVAVLACLAPDGAWPAAAGETSTIERLDPAFAARDATGDWLWYDARKLTVEGRGWDDTERFFDRLPGRAHGVVRDAVWSLSRHAAGLTVRFRTDADTVAARWTVTSPELAMPHMPATGVSGLDLYVHDGATWRWLGNGRPTGRSTQTVLATGIPAADDGAARDYLLCLPLYNGVENLEIGIAPTASMAPADAGPGRTDIGGPIVFYGTSITQGGCASRPGMAYPAILRRRLDRPVINLGFSGNGRLDPELGVLLAEIDATAYVLDCAANMTSALIAERTEPFVTALRAARPHTPIVLVGNVPYPAGAVLPHTRDQVAAKNAAIEQAFDRLTARGVGGLVFVPGTGLLGTDGDDTVDGTHPTDLGFRRMADALEPVLRRVVEPTFAVTPPPGPQTAPPPPPDR